MWQPLRAPGRAGGTRIVPIVPVQVGEQRSERASRRTDFAALTVALGFAAAVTVTGVALGSAVLAGKGPLYAAPLPHVGPGTPAAIAVAIAVLARGPRLAQQLPWPRLLVAGYATAVAWTLSLAMVDGWGWFTSRLTGGHEYLSEVGGVTDVGAMLAGFVDRIPGGSPGIWATHVAGHPPGAFLVFIGLDRVGLGGGVAASLACVLVGGLAAVAVPVTLRALGDEPAARAVVPFAALFPGAVWVGASADGLFAGVTATGVALLALACAGHAPRHDVAALAGGVALGYGLYVSYGLTLMALPVLAVALVTRRLRPLLVGGGGVAAVVLAFTASGFWWFDGYSALVVRYHADIAADRPYAFWVFANLACLLVVAGPLVVRAMPLALRCRRTPAAALFLAAAAAVALADLSGLSKAETERIWLPFAVWLLAGAALLPPPSRRFWLVAAACTALAVNHLLLTVW